MQFKKLAAFFLVLAGLFAASAPAVAADPETPWSSR